MDEPHKWERSRYFALVVVSAMHVSLVIALLIAAKIRVLRSATNSIELLVLTPTTAPRTAVPAPAHAIRHKEATPSVVPPSSAITIFPQAPAVESAGPTVDWAQEAQNVAASIAKNAAAESHQESALGASPRSPFAPPPAHHKGEQIPTADGQWIVYVSDDCYQMSKSITYIENATNTGMILQTYCNRPSKVPRGDLFKQLPAYKKLHPDN